MPHGDAAFGDYVNNAGLSHHRGLGGQLKILQKGRENVMKNLLFFTAAALLLVESTAAYAIGDSVFTRTDKWSGSAQREVWGPPCHMVRVRIGTHNGHAVYET